MTQNTPTEPEDLLLLTSAIVRAYVSNNAVSAPDLPALIKQTHTALKTLGEEAAPEPEAEQRPAVPVKKSVTPDFIICLEDGKEFRSLKRHLRTAFAMTPDEYRAKWNLPSDYPMVAPNYSATRSSLAKNFGLGRKAP